MSASRPRPRRAWGVLPCLLLWACNQDVPAVAVVGVRHIIDPWLLCHDCTDGELDSVAEFGKVNPAVAETLSTDLLYGPVPARRQNIEQQLQHTFDGDTAFEMAAGVSPSISSVDYIQLYAGNYVAVYRARAAIALAAIGGGRAGAALDSAIAGQLRPGSDPLRPDVTATATAVKDTVWSP
jgi:hypothetical protein